MLYLLPQADGLDESLVPIDLDWAGPFKRGSTKFIPRTAITDDELFESLFGLVPDGVELVAFFDCCHSGTMSDLKKVEGLTAAGPSVTQKGGEEELRLHIERLNAGKVDDLAGGGGADGADGAWASLTAGTIRERRLEAVESCKELHEQGSERGESAL